MAEEIKKEETQTEEQPKKQGFFTENRIEILVAFFLGITALLTAWATWIGSLHGGNQATNYTLSNNLAAEGNAEYNLGLQAYQADLMTWNKVMDYQFEVAMAVHKGDAGEVDFVIKKAEEFMKNNVENNEHLGQAVEWALDQDEKKKAAAAAPQAEKKPEVAADAGDGDDDAGDGDDDAANAQDGAQNSEEEVENKVDTSFLITTSPFDMPGFVQSYFANAQKLLDESQKRLEDGQKDNSNGDKFNLVNVIYSVVLFLLGIVGVFKRIPNRKVMLIIAVVALLLATIYMLRLPMPTDFSFGSFFSSNP